MKPAEMGTARRAFVCLVALPLVLTYASCSSRRFAVEGSSGPRPIAVLLSVNALDVGQTTPRVVVYEDGQVIFTAWKNLMRREWPYLTYKLEPSALSVLRRQIHELVEMNPRSSYKALDEGQMVMDASYEKMYVREGRHEAFVSVYALGHVLHPHASASWKPRLRSFQEGGPPPQFLSLFHELELKAGRPVPLAHKWNPRQMEVRLRDDARHVGGPIVPWPDGWPEPGSGGVRATGDHTWYALLDGAELPRLRRLLPSNSEEGAVLIHGKVWSAYWRPVLPLEDKWLAAMKRSKN